VYSHDIKRDGTCALLKSEICDIIDYLAVV